MPELLPFQQVGVDYLQAAPRRLLIDDPGLGKTAQLLMALPDEAAALVVTQSSLASVWLYETDKWRPDLVCNVVSSAADFRWPRKGEVLVCSYGMVPDKPSRPPAEIFLIADEVHNVKNSQADRTRRFRDLRHHVLKAGGSVWGATGTPLYNDPPDLWGVLESLGLANDVFGRYGTLVYMFRGYPTRFGMRWGSPRPEVKDLIARHVLGRRRTDVLPDLPTKFYQTIRVDIDQHRVPMYLVNPDGKSPDISRARAALAQQKVRAVLPALKEMASREALVVFSYHRAAVEEAAQALGVPMAVGGTDVADMVARFQSGALSHIVGTTGALGTGFTLVRSHVVVFIDRDWTPAMNEQAEDRVCRIGQTTGVRIIDVVCDHPLDDHVRRVIAHKEEIVAKSVEAAKEGFGVFASTEDLLRGLD